MKWYFSLSEASIDRPDHGWRDLIRTAIRSARQNTTLTPCMLYDGKEGSFTTELRAMGVTIIRHRVAFYDKLAERGPGYLAIASGAFLRVEIPEIEHQDTTVLYTDCDVMFRSDPSFKPLHACFASAPQTSLDDYKNDMNTGVMLMNLPSMRADLPRFKEFIIKNLNEGWPGCDQENYRRFYAGRWDQLPSCFNWKPYWGTNSDSVITHWHGPKPMLIRKLLAGRNLVTNPDWRRLYDDAPASYQAALAEWDAIGTTTPQKPTRLFVDALTPSRVRGWAHNPARPTEPMRLSFQIDGTVVWEGSCDQARPDVLAAGYPIGNVGFDFALPTLDSSTHQMTIHNDGGEPLAISHNTHSMSRITLPQAQPGTTTHA